MGKQIAKRKLKNVDVTQTVELQNRLFETTLRMYLTPLEINVTV